MVVTSLKYIRLARSRCRAGQPMRVEPRLEMGAEVVYLAEERYNLHRRILLV
jgi:hypothetical protein